MKNIVYCVHVEIENAVRCTRKSSGVATSFVGFAAFFVSCVRKKSLTADSAAHIVFATSFRMKKEKMYAKK